MDILAPAYLPTILPPKPWTGPRGGGYWTGAVKPLPLVKTRQANYHHVIARDGTVHEGRPQERASVQAGPHNRTAIGVAYVGGLDAAGKRNADTRTPEQRAALRALLADLRRQHPEASIHGRYYGGMPGLDPQFNPTEEYRDL